MSLSTKAMSRVFLVVTIALLIVTGYNLLVGAALFVVVLSGLLVSWYRSARRETESGSAARRVHVLDFVIVVGLYVAAISGGLLLGGVGVPLAAIFGAGLAIVLLGIRARDRARDERDRHDGNGTPTPVSPTREPVRRELVLQVVMGVGIVVALVAAAFLLEAFNLFIALVFVAGIAGVLYARSELDRERFARTGPPPTVNLERIAAEESEIDPEIRRADGDFTDVESLRRTTR